jgi:long-chain fatty acid transport protein
MKRIKTFTWVAAALACAAVAPESVLAGGLYLYEIGTPDVGLASAGYAARVQDASTVFKNPAGMSYLQTPQMQSGLQLLYGSVEFNKDSSTTTSGGNGGNAIGALPGASLFIVYPVSDKLAVGFGMFSYFGLAENYKNDWVGRYYMQDATLLGMSFMPSASYKLTDWLSVGAGLNAMFGYLDSQVAVRQPNFSDGTMHLKDEVWGFGANVGILIEPCKGTRIGVTYLSPVDLDFKDRPSFHDLGPVLGALPRLQNPGRLKLGVTVPQAVMASIYHQLNEKWAVMADVGWQNWSEFGQVEVGVDSSTGQPSDAVPSTINLKYDDTWHGALGAQYQYSEKWEFTGGFAYDTSAVSDSHRTVTLPLGEAYRFGLGTIWHWKKNVDLGLSYEFLWAGDMPVSQGTDTSYRGRVSGSFDNAWFSFATANFTWRF